MKHDWDNYTSTEIDTCKKCGLVRRRVAKLHDVRGLYMRPMWDYFINGVWIKSSDIPKSTSKCDNSIKKSIQ